MNFIKITPDHKKEVINIFRSTFTKKQWDDWLEEDIDKAVFADDPYYHVQLYGIQINDKIVSIAGVSDSMFLDEVKMFRLGATLPEYANTGLMDKLISYRIGVVSEDNKGILVSTKYPHRYEKHGFKMVDNNTEHKVLYLNVHKNH